MSTGSPVADFRQELDSLKVCTADCVVGVAIPVQGSPHDKVGRNQIFPVQQTQYRLLLNLGQAKE
jgi:hypothetical protein